MAAATASSSASPAISVASTSAIAPGSDAGIAAASQAAVAPRMCKTKAGMALMTPSWTAIVDAFNRDGDGDREMLLALLHAKAKEDERLAALDLLHAEQLRAYAAHLAAHGPFAGPRAAEQSRDREPLRVATPAHPQSSAVAAVATASTSRQHGSRAAHASRSPSLSRTADSRQSSPSGDSDTLKTPHEEHKPDVLLADPSASRHGTSSSSRSSKAASVDPEASAPAALLYLGKRDDRPQLSVPVPPPKRKRVASESAATRPAQTAGSPSSSASSTKQQTRPTPPVVRGHARRVSPVQYAPSLRSLPAPYGSAAVQATTPSHYSLKHILNNDEMHPHPTSRLQMSDLRTSA